MEKVKGYLRSSNSKKTLKDGKVPGIIYSKEMSNIMFEISELDVRKTVKSQGDHGMLDIEIDGEEYKAIINEIQKEPITKKIIHLDLKEVKPENIIVDMVPLYYVGDEQLEKKGAILQRERESVRVRCMAKQIPNNIKMDVGNFKVGDNILISHLPVIEGIEYMDVENTHLASIVGIK